jgi:putative PIN family toxin of toxin-antitoxin system
VIAPLVVYDTMVFLQAAISPNRRYATFDAVEDNRLSLCLSVELAAEVRDVLTRPVQTRRFPALTPQRVAQFLDKVNALATLFHDVPPIFDWPQHPDDNHVFNLAIRARAKYLVTWETRILKLANDSSAAAESLRRLAPDLVIITPKQLADLLRQPE